MRTPDLRITRARRLIPAIPPTYYLPSIFRFLEEEVRAERWKTAARRPWSRRKATAAGAARRDVWPAADLADAPGGTLSAGISRAARARRQLPRFLLLARAGGRGDACSRSAASAWMRRSCSPTSWWCRMRWAAAVGFREGEGRCSSRCAGARRSMRSIATACPSGWRRSMRRCARVRPALPDETALIGFAGAPWTVATYMVEGGTQPRFRRGEALGLRRSRRVRAC